MALFQGRAGETTGMTHGSSVTTTRKTTLTHHTDNIAGASFQDGKSRSLFSI